MSGDESDGDTRVLAASPRERLLGGAVVARRYEVRGVLGVGGMGSVYDVFDRNLEERVALKILQAGERADATLVERFRREVRLARRISHRNTARVYDIGVDGERWYLTMELIDGESLQALLERESRLPITRACAIMADVCAGLAAIHAAGVVHRDLKPGNVLLERGGRVAITDFGIARKIKRGADDPLMTCGMIGTPLYMAPEQAVGSPEVDARADIYAVGVMLYRLLTGEFPGLGFARPAGFAARRASGTPDPRHVLPLPDALAELVQRCMALAPGERPARADELGAALRRWADGELTEAARVAARVRVEPDARARETLGDGPRSRSDLRPPGERALVVLPFRARGRAEDDFLAEALAEELSDLLSRTRGLWVIGGGAAASFAERRDPREIGRELAVDVVVDGAIQRAGDRVRISARLSDVGDGSQLWSGRFDGALADVFELQDRMARQIAEALRVELATLAHRGTASPEAIEYYMRGRAKTRGFGKAQQAAVALFERSLQLAEEFKPAIAAHAFATLRGWFFAEQHGDRDWGARVEATLARARRDAPELAETQIALGVYSLQLGDYPRAVIALRRALEIAPTCALAHQYLGLIEVEAGRFAEGRERLKLAVELDPTLITASFELARSAALIGDQERYERLVRRIVRIAGYRDTGAAVLEMRVASWSGDLALARAAYQHIGADPSPEDTAAQVYARAILEAPAEEVLDEMLRRRQQIPNLRFRSLSAQLIAEQLALRGQPRRALELVREATGEVLVDIEWLERCPALTEVRREPGYAEVREALRKRARAVWS